MNQTISLRTWNSQLVLHLSRLEVYLPNFAVDGVSCESSHVWITICKFLSSECNHIGSTYPNHNGKSWRYQIIASGGDEIVSLGSYMLDTYIFRLSNIAMGIFRPNYFASERLLLELVWFESIHKMSMLDAAPYEDKFIIALALFFVGLSLYAVNGKQVLARHRTVYVWYSSLLLTYLRGVPDITKINIVE